MKLIVLLSFMCMTFKTSTSQFDCQKLIWNICYEDESYPSEEIHKKWRDMNENTQMMFGRYVKSHWESEKILESCKLCETSTSLRIQPISLIAETEKIYLMNTAKYPVPKIDIKICKKDATCMIENLQNDFETSCIQKKSKINVLAYNATSQSFQGIAMAYPSACECIIEANAK